MVLSRVYPSGLMSRRTSTMWMIESMNPSKPTSADSVRARALIFPAADVAMSLRVAIS